MTCSAGLILLPDEILLKIFKDKTLSVKDVLNLHITCHRFDDIYESQDLWKSKFIQRWPWVWKKILMKETANKDLKKELRTGLESTKSLNAQLKTFSNQLYRRQNITTPILTPIMSLLNSGSFTIHILINELREILKEGSCRDMTIKYYAEMLLQHLHEIQCREDWKHFFSLPANEQTLERGTFLFAKWFQPKPFLDFEYRQMTDEFDNLAGQVLSHLRTKYPNHPALSQKLIYPDSVSSVSLWEKRECERLFECVNHIIFAVNKYKGNEEYYLMDNSFINRVIEMKKGIPVTLSILYQAVCHRLGLVLCPVNCPSHFLLKWWIPNTDDFEFVDAFYGGKRTTGKGMSLSNHPNISARRIPHHASKQVLERMANNTFHVAEWNFQRQVRYKELCTAAEISSIFNPDDNDTMEFIYKLYAKLDIHADRILAGCAKVLDDSRSQRDPNLIARYDEIREEATQILESQEKEPEPVIPKYRTGASINAVKFATGMVMNHKLYDYTCVIFGWDTKCTMPMNWVLQMNVHLLKYQHNQPFYNVLGADGSHRYAAQENLLLPSEPTLVTHEEVGKHFRDFNGYHYVPNKELASEYPDEERVRNKYYPHLYK